MVSLMLDNLLLEAGIATSNLTQTCLEGPTGIEPVQKAIEGCIYTPERNQPSNLFHVINNVTSMDTQYATNFAIKLEPAVEDLEIGNVPLEIATSNIADTQLETPLHQLDNFKMIINIVHDHSYCAVFNIPYYREVESNIEYFRTEKQNHLKIETSQAINDSEKVHNTIYEDWKIKNEELDIEEEDLDPQETSIVPVHMLLHNNTEERGKFKCDVCEYETLRKSSLKRHILRHQNPEEHEKFKCDVCDFETLRKDSLKKHMLRHQNPEEHGKFKCCICEFQTLHKCSIKRHILRHQNPEEQEKYNCDVCEYETFFKSSLKRHMLRHQNPDERKKYKCDVCEFETLRKDSLKTHLLRH